MEISIRSPRPVRPRLMSAARIDEVQDRGKYEHREKGSQRPAGKPDFADFDICICR